MANGTIAFDTLTTSDTANTGTEKSIDTSYIFNGVAKCWMNADGGSSDAAVVDSFNVSSIGDNGGGDYTTNFTNSFSNATYVKTGNAENNLTSDSEVFGVSVGDKTTAKNDFRTRDASDGTTAVDAERMDVVFDGDFA